MLLPILMFALPASQGLGLEALRASHEIRAWDDQVVAVPTSPGRHVTIPIELGGRRVHLELAAKSVRGPDFHMYVQAGGELVEMEPPPSCTYQGSVLEWPDSLVAASIYAGELQATIRATDGSYWAVEPVSGLGLPGAPGVHVAYRNSDLTPSSVLCPVPDEFQEVPMTSGNQGGTAQVAELAVDADYEYFLLRGGVNRTQIAMDTRIAAVSLVYEDAFDMSWLITESVIRTDPNDDPYAGYGGDYEVLANLVADHWKNEQARKLPDAVHLFSEKHNNFYVGYAIGKVCSCRIGIASREGKASLNEMERTILVAHELGHVMGTVHCDTSPGCFIMCPSIGDCDGPALMFGDLAMGHIASTVASAACITPEPVTTPPFISATVPDPVPMLGQPSIQIQGTDMSDLVFGQLDFGTSVQTLDRCMLSSDSEGLAHFATPTPPNLGPATLTISNRVGESNEVTIDFVATSPPLMLGPALIDPNFPLGLNSWFMGAGSLNDVRVLVAINDDTTIQTGTGATVLLNAAVAGEQTLDHLGLGTFTRSIPPSLSGNTLYTQFVVIDSGGTILEASNIVSTDIL